MGTTNVRKVAYMGMRKKSTKARKCRVKECKNRLREENKSGYCTLHLSKSPKVKMRAIKSARKNRKKNVGLHINREVYNNYSDFCEQYGFNKKKKLELIVKEFLEKQNEGGNE